MFEGLGLGGAYLLSAMLYLAAGAAVIGLDFRQEPRRLRFGRIPGEIAEGLAVARATPAILGVVLVTIVMNTSGFCYSALIAPIGLDVYLRLADLGGGCARRGQAHWRDNPSVSRSPPGGCTSMAHPLVQGLSSFSAGSSRWRCRRGTGSPSCCC